jgi:hypothetical protein
MANIEIALPAGIGEEVSVAGQDVLMMGWRVVRPRFLLGGDLDRAPQLSLQVLTEQGDELWLGESAVAGLADPVVVNAFLPFAGGDAVRVQPSGARGEVVGWEVIGRRLGVQVIYRVRLTGTSTGEEIEVDARDLVPWAG